MAPTDTIPPVNFPSPTTADKLGEFMPSNPEACSLQAGWTNLVVRRYRLPAGGEIVLPPVPDPCLTVHLSACVDKIERSFGDGFSKAALGFDSVNFVPPNHGVCWRWTEEVEVLHMHINHEFIKTYVAQAEASLDVQSLESVDWLGAQEPLISQIGRTCMVELQTCRSHVDRLYIDSLAAALVARLFHQHGGDHASGDSPVRPRFNINGVRAALRYIRDNLDKDMSLESLAGVANLSLYHFIRRFRAVTGMTPHQYVLSCRIEQAKALLQGISISIIEVGQRSGFSSHSHFTNTFRQQVGMTPTAYRQLTVGSSREDK